MVDGHQTVPQQPAVTLWNVNCYEADVYNSYSRSPTYELCEFQIILSTSLIVVVVSRCGHV